MQQSAHKQTKQLKNWMSSIGFEQKDTIDKAEKPYQIWKRCSFPYDIQIVIPETFSAATAQRYKNWVRQSFDEAADGKRGLVFGNESAAHLTIT